MNLPSLLDMTAPCRENFEIPYHVLGDPAADFKAALVAGVRGNEPNGVFILSRLADYLRGVHEGRSPGVSLNGRVVIVPAVNVLGLNLRMRLWPFDKTDINRMFPGYDQGETTQRIAWALLQVTREAQFRIEIRSSNMDIEEAPHLRLYEPSTKERQSAEHFGLTMVEGRMKPVLSVSLMRAWKDSPGESFLLRAGHAAELQLAHCEKIFRALLQFLVQQGILRGEKCFLEEEENSFFKSTCTFRLISDQAGFFVSKKEVGKWVQAGEHLGVLYDAYTGQVRTEFSAPKSGLLLSLRRQPLVFEGDLIAKLLVRP